MALVSLNGHFYHKCMVCQARESLRVPHTFGQAYVWLPEAVRIRHHADDDEAQFLVELYTSARHTIAVGLEK